MKKSKTSYPKVNIGSKLPQDLDAQVQEITGTVSVSFLVTNDCDYQLVREYFDELLNDAVNGMDLPSCSKSSAKFTTQQKSVVLNDHITRDQFDEKTNT